MKILIIDDEQIALQRLKRLLNELGHEDIIETTKPEEVVDIVSGTKIDVIFLDMEMPNLHGLELANRLMRFHIPIIFQTAYDNFALDAFGVGAVDYILKPIESESLKKALSRIKVDTEVKFLTKMRNKIYLIKPEEVFYIKAELAEMMFRTREGYSYIQKRMYELEDLLDMQTFVKVHRSYLVNLDKIKSLEVVEQSKFKILFDGIDDTVISSKDGAKHLRDVFTKFVS